jgi:hypothetical protein
MIPRLEIAIAASISALRMRARDRAAAYPRCSGRISPSPLQAFSMLTRAY